MGTEKGVRWTKPKGRTRRRKFLPKSNVFPTSKQVDEICFCLLSEIVTWVGFLR